MDAVEESSKRQDALTTNQGTSVDLETAADPISDKTDTPEKLRFFGRRDLEWLPDEEVWHRPPLDLEEEPYTRDEL